MCSRSQWLFLLCSWQLNLGSVTQPINGGVGFKLPGSSGSKGKLFVGHKCRISRAGRQGQRYHALGRPRQEGPLGDWCFHSCCLVPEAYQIYAFQLKGCSGFLCFERHTQTLPWNCRRTTCFNTNPCHVPIEDFRPHNSIKVCCFLDAEKSVIFRECRVEDG